MGAIQKNSFVWASLGIEPPLKEDAIYEAGEQPIAGFDNYVNWAITSDIDALNEYVGDHASEHEAGGQQEINLSGLSIGFAGTLVGTNTTDETEVRIEHDDGTPEVRIDMDDGSVRDFPEFAIQPTFREGIQLGQHIRSNGGIVYDYNADYFHRAEQAKVAELAEDSNHLEGNTLQDILDMIGGDIEDSFPSVSDSGVERVGAATGFNFGTSIDVHPSGSTVTMDVESVPHADVAEQAVDSDHLEGYTVQEIVDLLETEIGDSYPAVDDDGTERLPSATRLDFGTSIDVTTDGETATMDVDSVPHADEAEFAYDSHRVDGYHASDLISMMGDAGRWNRIGSWQIEEQDGFAWAYDFVNNDDVYDFYRLALVHEFPHHNKSHRAIGLQLNEDNRSRYNYRYSTYHSQQSPEVFHGVSTGNSSFPVCVAPGTKRTVAEYQIAAPARIGDAGDLENEDIFVGRVGNGAYPKTYPTFIHGAYTTSAETATDLRLFAENNAINVSIGLWGRNITR